MVSLGLWASAAVADEIGTPAIPPVSETAPPASVTPPASEFLPRHALFAPLLADPRWPQFSAVYESWGGRDGLRDVAAVSFGDSLPLFQQNAWGSRWEIGIKPAVYAILDVDSDPKSLVNADYRVGIPLSWRNGDWSAFVEAYHQSSHLGDQYVLDHPVQRIEVSYEAFNLMGSRFLWDRTIRLYAGGQYLVDREPSALKAFTVQGGAEWRSPVTFIAGTIRPFAAVDVQATQTTNWQSQISTRAGVELQGKSDSYTLQVSVDWYRGRNLNGQFYFTSETEDILGLGLHAYF